MFDDSLGVGFDIYQNDPDSTHPGDINANHVSVHYDNAALCTADATPIVDLASGAWIHARIVLEFNGEPRVSIILNAPGEAPSTLIDGCLVPGMMHYEGRVFFGARSGGLSADHDLDNIAVTFSSPVNPPPVANAGPRQSVNTGDLVILDGTGSSDPDGGPLTYLWSQVGGPAVSLSDPTSSQPDFFAPAVATELSFELVVNDGESDSTAAPVTVTVAEPSEIGSWGPAFDAEIVPVHAILLPTGSVLYWEEGGYEGEDPDEILGENRLWDPVSGLGDPTDPPFDAFCSGHSFLDDGTVLVTGGHDLVDGVGLPDAAVYDPESNTWAQIPDMGPAGEGRWYPTNTTLDNGDVLVISGTKDANFTENRLPQIWQPAEGTWLDLTDAEAAVSHLPDADHPLGANWVIYPRMFLAPDGRVFKADANPNQKTWFLDTAGLGTWIEGPMTNFPGESGTFLGGSRDYGSAVNYETGKILIVGGGDPPTATAEVIDLSDPTPTWRLVSPMAAPRRHLNAVLLPDGSVLAVGGTSSPDFNNATDSVLEAEMWHPGSETWSTVASMENPRVYHSIALLLPDGRVLAGGGGRPGPQGHVEQRNFEIYSPPYLFSGPQPSITSAPQKVNHGQTFFLETPDAANISKVTWIRLSAVTHAFDQNQRLNLLSFSQAAGGLLVTAPASPTIAPPGHYMLFILNTDGVPSVASIVQITKCPWRLGHAHYCRDCGPCYAGEGDCDAGQCVTGLVCSQNVGADYGFPAHHDVCEQPPSCPLPLGHGNYCAECGPCDVGEGDCDGNGECNPGLVCVNDVGADYGFPAHHDVCEQPSGCPLPLGHGDYCAVCGPCDVGEGDCDGNGQCLPGLVCVNDVGADYGFPAHHDVCEQPSGCPLPLGHGDYCAECGPCDVGEGDCDGNGECNPGLVCVNDVGADYGFPAHHDVCEVP